MSSAPGDRIVDGKYELLEALGSGGNGQVHLARDLRTGARVALKVLLLPNDAEIVSRFRREAKAAQAIDDPHCVRLLDFGEDRGEHILYIAMELAEGESLDAALERSGGSMDVERAAGIVLGILRALEAAHRVGVVHRDLKPENVMVSGDDVKVCDFGSAKLLRRDITQLTTPGAVIGTGSYMAPEQARGLPCDARADLYAAGVILFELLTGKIPSRPTDRAGDPRLDPVFARALADHPEDRFASARAMIEALSVAVAATEIVAPPKRSPRALAAAIAGVAVIGTLALAFAPAREEPPVAKRETCSVPSSGEAQFIADRPLEVHAAGVLIGRTPLAPRSFPSGALDLEVVDPATATRRKLRVYIEANTRRIFQLSDL